MCVELFVCINTNIAIFIHVTFNKLFSWKMTVPDESKDETQVQEQLAQLYVSDDKKTNMVKLDRKPRQCMGKVKYF